MRDFLQFMAWLGAAIGCFFLFVGLTASQGAPQEAAAAALAVAFVVIPYCVSATVQRQEIIARLRASNPD